MAPPCRVPKGHRWSQRGVPVVAAGVVIVNAQGSAPPLHEMAAGLRTGRAARCRCTSSSTARPPSSASSTPSPGRPSSRRPKPRHCWAAAAIGAVLSVRVSCVGQDRSYAYMVMCSELGTIGKNGKCNNQICVCNPYRIAARRTQLAQLHDGMRYTDRRRTCSVRDEPDSSRTLHGVPRSSLRILSAGGSGPRPQLPAVRWRVTKARACERMSARWRRKVKPSASMARSAGSGTCPVRGPSADRRRKCPPRGAALAGGAGRAARLPLLLSAPAAPPVPHHRRRLRCRRTIPRAASAAWPPRAG